RRTGPRRRPAPELAPTQNDRDDGCVGAGPHSRGQESYRIRPFLRRYSLLPPRSLRISSVSNPSSNERRVRLIRASLTTAAFGARVKPRCETPAPGSLGHPLSQALQNQATRNNEGILNLSPALGFGSLLDSALSGMLGS